MKLLRYPLSVLLIITLEHTLHAQGGVWTWIGGSASPGGVAIYGPQGVPGPTVTPPALFDPQTWTDQAGYFWLFSGREADGYWHSDLWKYDPILGQWAFMDGPSVPSLYAGNLGTMGVPAAMNQPPGTRSAATWVGADGDFWMFGGDSPIGTTNMLWRYEPGSNTWTWMNGTTDLFDTGSWGTKGVASPSNRPSPRVLVEAAWTDDSGDLWMFGGSNGNYWADLWKYHIASGEWTWVSGSDQPFASGHYGAQGIGSDDRYPCFRSGSGAWRATDGAFWLMGGLYGGSSGLNDLWRYDPMLNEWSWWAGDSLPDPTGDYPPYCEGSSSSTPGKRYGHQTDWTGTDGTLWSFGGTSENGFGTSYNDMWKYCIATDEWSFIKGSDQSNPPGSWGTLGVAAATNIPNARAGAATWMDAVGNCYLFGGTTNSAAETFNDMWRYAPDPVCAPCGETSMEGPAIGEGGVRWSVPEECLVLSFPDVPDMADVRVTDAAGRTVATWNGVSVKNSRLHADLASGIHLVRIQAGATTSVVRIVVERSE